MKIRCKNNRSTIYRSTKLVGFEVVDNINIVSILVTILIEAAG